MAKPEWGQKRTCTSCGCRFYDLTRSPITCPKCGATVEPEMPFKVRRSSVPAEAKAAARAAAEKVVVKDVVDDETLDAEEETPEEDESGLMEDASDLGEDDDDMAEVMEHMDEGLEEEI
ncbi:TIGR02300 family protein [Magnetospirillum sulfuroxidans]|uniref:TIGR02300 family protein n=1 Tax=Magnetospirillum sulfuroxidans TaxID=611300 RepID=A0ABS5IFN5_9PROT|nr:TIGR02300 family protein [Magnetospirillum sulfuroxidans]